jgi:hypothetical protein
MTDSPPENGGRTLVASASKDGSSAGWSEHVALYRSEKASGTKEEGLVRIPVNGKGAFRFILNKSGKQKRLPMPLFD